MNPWLPGEVLASRLVGNMQAGRWREVGGESSVELPAIAIQFGPVDLKAGDLRS